ncbi:hypothetical protein RI129_003529, partial [Pyrocoelia pectoralis]
VCRDVKLFVCLMCLSRLCPKRLRSSKSSTVSVWVEKESPLSNIWKQKQMYREIDQQLFPFTIIHVRIQVKTSGGRFLIIHFTVSSDYVPRFRESEEFKT